VSTVVGARVPSSRGVDESFFRRPLSYRTLPQRPFNLVLGRPLFVMRKGFLSTPWRWRRAARAAGRPTSSLSSGLMDRDPNRYLSATPNGFVWVARKNRSLLSFPFPTGQVKSFLIRSLHDDHSDFLSAGDSSTRHARGLARLGRFSASSPYRKSFFP